MRRLTAVGVAVAISAAVATAPIPGAVTTAPAATSLEAAPAHRSAVDVGYVPKGTPEGFDPIATRADPNGLLLASPIDIVWLRADGMRLLLDHTDGVCSEHVSTDVVEHDELVVLTMVYEVERAEPLEPLVEGTVALPLCPAIGILHRSSVELASPLGSRQLLAQTVVNVVTAQDE